MPGDTRANDLWVCQTTIVVENAIATAQRLTVSASISPPAVVTLADAALGFKQGFLMPDSDGHLLRIVEP